PIASLSPATRAAVAIARARRVLEEHAERFTFILDEPTVYLSAQESSRVMTLMRAVADSGSAVVFISHRMQEVMTVADRITVLRDGRVADTFPASQGNQRRIIGAMLGRSLDQFYPDRVQPAPGAPLLRVSGLAGRMLAGISFDAAPGEIIGFAGLVGMGHEEIPYLIGGVARPTAGRAELDGTDVLPLPLRARIKLGVAMVPGNRPRDGAWPAASAQENITLSTLALGSSWRPLRPAAERRESSSLMTLFGVRPPAPKLRVAQFSGGNQQKIVLAKWMSTSPKVLLLDEPTQGIDAGAKFEILQMISDAASDGAVVLIFSGDYEQLAHICNRVLVLRHGRVTAELLGAEITEPAIAHLAQGEPADPGNPA
ncbi:MAG: ATP-binding cassette domain-containing protein, partial [Streptosporangiaceae bacterium]